MQARLVIPALLLAIACDRGHPREAPPPPQPPPPAAAPATAAAATATGCTLKALPLRRPMPARLVAIGDLHGDLAGARAALRAAGAIDAEDRWIGGELVVVQLGDILDRGDDEQAILDLIFKLEAEARAAGGAMIMLLGNHELMNAAADFRYVTPGAIGDFDDVPGLDPAKHPRVPEPVRRRLAALGPGGVYARRLAAHDVVTIVGDTVFSHAGVIGDWVTQVDQVNLSSRCWLDGQAGGPDALPIAMAQTSPVWTRAAGLDPVDCGAVARALAALGVTRMVVGHTVQAKGITPACDGTLWRIDVGISKAYGGPVEVLELAPGAPPKVIEGARAP